MIFAKSLSKISFSLNWFSPNLLPPAVDLTLLGLSSTTPTLGRRGDLIKSSLDPYRWIRNLISSDFKFFFLIWSLSCDLWDIIIFYSYLCKKWRGVVGYNLTHFRICYSGESFKKVGQKQFRFELVVQITYGNICLPEPIYTKFLRVWVPFEPCPSLVARLQ